MWLESLVEGSCVEERKLILVRLDDDATGLLVDREELSGSRSRNRSRTLDFGAPSMQRRRAEPSCAAFGSSAREVAFARYAWASVVTELKALYASQ
jgi:hypothetical protein